MSPYCECSEGKCTHPGYYDAREISVITRKAERNGVIKLSEAIHVLQTIQQGAGDQLLPYGDDI